MLHLCPPRFQVDPPRYPVGRKLRYDSIARMNTNRISVPLLVLLATGLLTACGPPPAPEAPLTPAAVTAPAASSPPLSPPQPAAATPVATRAQPDLPTALTCDCPLGPTPGGFERVGIAVGEEAINFTLQDTAGKYYRLSRLLGEKPVVMVFGSFT